MPRTRLRSKTQEGNTSQLLKDEYKEERNSNITKQSPSNTETSDIHREDVSSFRSGDEEVEMQIDVEAVEDNAHNIACREQINNSYVTENSEIEEQQNIQIYELSDVPEGQLVEQSLVLGQDVLTLHIKMVDGKRVVYIPNKTEKLPYDEYLTLLKTAEQTPDMICRDPPYIHLEGGCIVLYDCSDIDKEGVLTDADVRSTLRIDGYRWSCSRGTRSLCNGLKRGYVNLYSPDNRGGDECFSRYEIWDHNKPNGIVLFHYVGNHKKALEVAQTMPHRNSKKAKPFLRTQPRVLRKIARSFSSVIRPDELYKMIGNEGHGNSDDLGNSLRGVQQVKNVIRYFKKKARLTQDGVYNIYLMEQLLKYRNKSSFVHEIVLPSVNITLFCSPLLSEFTTCHRMSNVKTARLVYERVPVIGSFKISVLSFKHPFFVDEPLIPLGFRIYENENEQGHIQFLRRLLIELPGVEDFNKLLVNDLEFNFDSEVPHLKVLKTWKSLKMMTFVELRVEKGSEFEETTTHILERLLGCDSSDAINNEWLIMKDSMSIKNWTNDVKIFEGLIIPQLMQYYAIYGGKDVNISCTEVHDLLLKPPSLTDYLHEMYNGQELPLDINMLCLFYFCNAYIKEVSCSYQQSGVLQLNPIFDEVLASGDLMEEAPYYVPISNIVDSVYRDASNPTTFLEGTPWASNRADLLDNDPDYAFHKSIASDSIAQQIVDDKCITITSPGQFQVTYRDESFVVNMGLTKSKLKFSCTCPSTGVCVHTRAVKVLLNVVGHSDDKEPSIEEERKRNLSNVDNGPIYTKKRRNTIGIQESTL
uniref:SWIM-type domain-containing protein n=1 Tax=Parastrongyloides trichosuri TaxID=131310 RepID=A0A0N4ZN27_PARTI